MADQRLEGSARDRWQQPAKIVEALRLHPGDTVADVGCGTGYLMPYLSRAVGAKGHVLSEEIQEQFMAGLRRRAKALGNVEVNLGTAEDPELSRRNVDAFVLLTVYHEVDHPVDFLKALRKYARPNARLAIIDFDANRHGDPPAPDGHHVAEAAVIQEAAAAGWQLSEKHNFISSQFYLVFRQDSK
jgi:ubiquinone/menaquinone biosynthesis C-methylase UbiE